MTTVSEAEFAKICADLKTDRQIICRHNPLGTDGEILLWMLLSVLVSYLSLEEIETPCLTGQPTAETYRQAIIFILKNRKTEPFKTEKYLDELTSND